MPYIHQLIGHKFKKKNRGYFVDCYLVLRICIAAVYNVLSRELLHFNDRATASRMWRQDIWTADYYSVIFSFSFSFANNQIISNLLTKTCWWSA